MIGPAPENAVIANNTVSGNIRFVAPTVTSTAGSALEFISNCLMQGDCAGISDFRAAAIEYTMMPGTRSRVIQIVWEVGNTTLLPGATCSVDPITKSASCTGDESLAVYDLFVVEDSTSVSLVRTCYEQHLGGLLSLAGAEVDADGYQLGDTVEFVYGAALGAALGRFHSGTVSTSDGVGIR